MSENIISDNKNIRLETINGVLTLTDGELTMSGDFTKMLPRLKQSNLEREMLVKASRVKGLDRPAIVVDATAGMGEDSLLLAAAGFQVKLFEYDPTIHALLADSIRRGLKDENLSAAVGNMELMEGDSIQGMKSMKESGIIPDVIYLDPMFPERQKSGMIKKKFQLLQQLERPCDNEEELLSAAIDLGAKKIIIKRPKKGPFLAGRKPSHSYDGKAIRYDCILL